MNFDILKIVLLDILSLRCNEVCDMSDVSIGKYSSHCFILKETFEIGFEILFGLRVDGRAHHVLSGSQTIGNSLEVHIKVEYGVSKREILVLFLAKDLPNCN